MSVSRRTFLASTATVGGALSLGITLALCIFSATTIAQSQTSVTPLGDIPTAARPRLLVLYHQLWFGARDATLLREVQSRYSGRVASARDLDRF